MRFHGLINDEIGNKLFMSPHRSQHMNTPTRKIFLFIASISLAGLLFAADLPRGQSHDALAPAIPAAPHETAGMVTLVAW